MQFYLGRHEYGDERDYAIANLENLGHRLDAVRVVLCCHSNYVDCKQA